MKIQVCLIKMEGLSVSPSLTLCLVRACARAHTRRILTSPQISHSHYQVHFQYLEAHSRSPFPTPIPQCLRLPTGTLTMSYILYPWP